MDDLFRWSEIIRNFAIVIGGAVGLSIAAWRGWAASRQAKASLDQAAIGRRQHVTEMFNNAVGQLGHEKLEVRLGAIFTLKQIANDFPQFGTPILELLSTYVRERGTAEGAATADIQAILGWLQEELGNE